MIPFNTSRAPTFVQLQQLYGNSALEPADVHASLPMQGKSYIEAGAKAMGIGDPVAFFERQRLARTMAATPTLPAQLAARDQAADTALAEERARAVALRGGSAFRTPLPIGNTADLSPLAQQDATERGIDPLNYALRNRAREAGVQVGELGGNTTFKNAPTASDLFNDPRFQNLHRSNPEHAGKLFSALTGSDLAAHSDAISKNRAASLVRQRNMYDEGLKSGLLKLDNGKLLQRERVADPMDPNKLTLGTNYVEPDEYHRIGWTPEVQREVLGNSYVDEHAEMNDLMSRKAGTPTQTTAAALTANRPPPPSFWDQTNPTGAGVRGVFDTINKVAENRPNQTTDWTLEALRGMGNTVARTVKGASNMFVGGMHELSGGLTPNNQVALPANIAASRAVAPAPINQARLHAVMANPHFQAASREEQQQIIANILGQ